MNKEIFIQSIRSGIEKFGYHITYVMPDISPGFAYTIGLSEKYNFELLFAGGVFYMREEVDNLLKGISVKLIEREGKNFDPITLDGLGEFSLSLIDKSWSKLLMLGVYDYYKTEKVYAFQIIPDKKHYTLDIPDMTQEFSTKNEPVWQWIVKEWEYNVPKESKVGTDIYFLQGEPLTEIARWEDNYWEMYHLDGEEVEKKDIRIVSLGTVFAIDPSILPAFELPLTKGLLRDNFEDPWRKWKW